MSEEFSIQECDSSKDGFMVKTIGGCRIVYGPIPARAFGMLTHGFSPKAQIAPDIADRIGATLVVGEPDAIENLRKQNLPVSEKRQSEYRRAMSLGFEDVAIWLRDGERGSSSNALCSHFFGIPTDAGRDHPHDPGDLRRCLNFLDATKTHDRIKEMANVSLEWAALVSIWPDLVQTMKKETQAGISAQGTYALMRSALAGK